MHSGLSVFYIPGVEARDSLSLLAKALCMGAYTSVSRRTHKGFADFLPLLNRENVYICSF